MNFYDPELLALDIEEWKQWFKANQYQLQACRNAYRLNKLTEYRQGRSMQQLVSVVDDIADGLGFYTAFFELHDELTYFEQLQMRALAHEQSAE